VEATVRYAAELGYKVTVVKDATVSYSDVEMHAVLEVNIPNYASAIVTRAVYHGVGLTGAPGVV
jgi:ureidoacrylate peracid hydrolase